MDPDLNFGASKFKKDADKRRRDAQKKLEEKRRKEELQAENEKRLQAAREEHFRIQQEENRKAEEARLKEAGIPNDSGGQKSKVKVQRQMHFSGRAQPEPGLVWTISPRCEEPEQAPVATRLSQ